MITVSVPAVNDILRHYSDYKAILKADAPLVQKMERYSPDDTLEDMLYPPNRLDGMRVQGGFMSDPSQDNSFSDVGCISGEASCQALR